MGNRTEYSKKYHQENRERILAQKREAWRNRSQEEREKTRQYYQQYHKARRINTCSSKMKRMREKFQAAFSVSGFQESVKTEQLLIDILSGKRILVKTHKEVEGENGKSAT